MSSQRLSLPRAGLTLLLLLLAQRSSFAESAKREIGGPYTLVHPIDQKWTGGPPPWPSPFSGRFYGTHGTVVGNQFYFYIGGGSYNLTTGPGSECPLEDVMIFSVPYTRDGMRGLSGIQYLGIATPCDKAHYTGGTVFKDNTRGGKYYMIVTRSGETTPCPSDFCELLVGQSTDGRTWTWSPLLTATNGLKIPDGMHVQPDPGRPGVWFGLFEFSSTIGGPTDSSGFVRIDWNGGVPSIYIADQITPAIHWRAIPVGGSLDFMPAIAWNVRVADLAALGSGRYEVWASYGVFPRSGDDPCPNGPTSLYIQNTANSPGNKLEYRTITPDFVLSEVRSVFPTSPPVRPLPADYLFAIAYPFRANPPEGRGHLYSSTFDPTICDHEINNFRSLGVVVTVLENIP